jgi:hypothetical protein
MTTTATDVIKDDDVAAIMEERTQAMYQFRRAYRDHDATGLNSGKFTFPEPTDDVRDEMVEVVEDADYPRTSLDHGGVDAEYTKDGVEIAISDEAITDSAIDIVADAIGEMGIAAEQKNDSEAFTGLSDNQNNTVVGTDGSDMNFGAVVEAYTTLVDGEYQPSQFELYLSPDAWGDLATDTNFNRATDQGDALAREGQLGTVFGVPVVMTNTGDLGADEGLMVDTSKFGYESTRWAQEVTNYREEGKDRDVYKIRDRRDFVVMDGQANVFIQGGV